MPQPILAYTPPFVQFKRAVTRSSPRTSHYQQTGIFITPDGDILLSAAIDDNPTSLPNQTGSPYSAIARSEDDGLTWSEIDDFAGYVCVMFAVGTDVYAMTCEGGEYGAIQIRKSVDDGVTFGTATTVRLKGTDGLFVMPPSPLIHGGRVYVPFMNTPNTSLGFSHESRLTILHCATTDNLMSSGNWTETNNVQFSKTGYSYTHQGLWEPTLLLDKNGDAKIVCRIVGISADAWLKDKAAICNVTLGASASISYVEANNPIDLPGAHVQFTVRLDSVSNKYLAITTRNTLGADTGAHWRQRTCLQMISSDDMLTWTHVADIIRSDQFESEFRITREGFQYSDWVFDGDDIIGVVRWAEFPDAINYHQATSMGFYRIKNYYQNLLAPAPTNSGASPSGPAAVTRNGQAI